MRVGTNVYCLQRLFYHTFEETASRLATSGISSVEIMIRLTDEKLSAPDGSPLEEIIRFWEKQGSIWGMEEATEKIQILRSHGLSVPGAHLGTNAAPEKLTSYIPALIRFAKENHIHRYVMNLLMPPCEIRAYLPALREISDQLYEAGIRFLYHNHEMELDEEEGKNSLDLVLESCPRIGLELDVGWVQYRKLSPVELMKRYQERLHLLHIKDIRADACPANRANCFTAIGEGCLPLGEIMSFAEKCPLYEDGIIIDQDKSPVNDIIGDLSRGVQNILRFSEDLA